MRKTYDVTNKVMDSATVPLQEWATNPPLLLSAQSEALKVLGLQWNTKFDLLAIKDLEWGEASSKRSLLSNSSQTYDRLGTVSPLTVSLK